MAVDQTELERLKATLSHLNEQIESVGSNDRSQLTELTALRQDLTELIALREEQLLADRKAVILNELQRQLAASASPVAETVVEQNTLNLKGTDKEAALISVADELKHAVIGQRCSIGGWTANGKFVRQNAVICDVVHERMSSGATTDTLETSTTAMNQEDLELPGSRIRVFLTHPTRTTDLPCSQFMNEGMCHRGIRCPWSHGKLVNYEDIGEWHEPNLELYLREGQPCLVKEHPYSPQMSVWRHAHLLHTDVDAQTCVIQWGHSYTPDSPAGSKVTPATGSERAGLRPQRKSYDQLEASVANVPIDAVWPLTIEDEENDPDSECDSKTVSTDSEESSSDDMETDPREAAMTLAERSASIGSFRSGQYAENQHSSNRSRSKIEFVPGGILNPEDVLRAIPYSDPVGSTTDSPTEETKAQLGSWEAHTRGIGSRLLAHMGYTGHGGLGTSGHGRVIPIALILEKFQILPHGWNKRPTLDRVLQSSSDRSKLVGRRGRHKPPADSVLDPYASADGKNTNKPWQPHLFQFLNNALRRTHVESNPIGLSKTSATSDQQPCCTTSVQSASPAGADFRVQLFRTQEEIGRTIQQMDRARQSIERNQGRDRIMTKQSEQRLTILQSQLDRLRSQERALLQSKHKQTAEKKLRIF